MVSITRIADVYGKALRIDDDGKNGRCAETGMLRLKAIFPSGLADDMNFVIFSTSGSHGYYTTIEEIEKSIKLYGEDTYYDAPGDHEPVGYVLPDLTVLVIKPRIACIQYGNVRVMKADIPWLKKLRRSSLVAVAAIGALR